MIKPLTEKQKVIYNFIFEFIKYNHYPPTFREIGADLNMSVKGVSDHISLIMKKGYVTYQAKKPRTLKILKEVA